MGISGKRAKNGDFGAVAKIAPWRLNTARTLEDTPGVKNISPDPSYFSPPEALMHKSLNFSGFHNKFSMNVEVCGIEWKEMCVDVRNFGRIIRVVLCIWGVGHK